MNNELVSGYVGKFVNIFSSGGSGFGINGTIINVVDNWLEFEAKGKKKLINIDYITSIEEVPQKK